MLTLLGHSMGCVVLWAYVDLFGRIVSRSWSSSTAPAVVQRDPDSTEQIVRETGAALTPDEVSAFAQALEGDHERAVRRFFGGM